MASDGQNGGGGGGASFLLALSYNLGHQLPFPEAACQS